MTKTLIRVTNNKTDLLRHYSFCESTSRNRIVDELLGKEIEAYVHEDPQMMDALPPGCLYINVSLPRKIFWLLPRDFEIIQRTTGNDLLGFTGQGCPD